MPASPIRQRHRIDDLEAGDPIFVLGPGGQAAMVQGEDATEVAGLVPESAVASSLLSEMLSAASTATESSTSREAHSTQASGYKPILSPESHETRRATSTAPSSSPASMSSIAPPSQTAALDVQSSTHESMLQISSNTISSSRRSDSAHSTPGLLVTSHTPTAAATTISTNSLAAETSSASNPASPQSASTSITQTAHAIAVPTQTGPAQPLEYNSFVHSPVFATAIVLGVLIFIALVSLIVRWAVVMRRANPRGRDKMDIAPSMYGSSPGETYAGQRVDDYRNTLAPVIRPEFGPSFSSTMPLAFTGFGSGGVEDLVASPSVAKLFPGAEPPLSDELYQTLSHPQSHLNSGANQVRGQRSRCSSQVSRRSAASANGGLQTSSLSGSWAQSSLAYPRRTFNPVDSPAAQILARERQRHNTNPFHHFSEDDTIPGAYVAQQPTASGQDSVSERDVGIWGPLEVDTIDRTLLRPWVMQESGYLGQGVQPPQSYPDLQNSVSTLGLEDDQRSVDLRHIATPESQVSLMHGHGLDTPPHRLPSSS